MVGFASIARTVSQCSKGMRTAVLTAAIGIAALSVSAQLGLTPWFARGAYLLRSTSLYSPSERREADRVFARYRKEGKPEEPVIASSMLFRYAHDRNLFWLNRMYGRPLHPFGSSATAAATMDTMTSTLKTTCLLIVTGVACCASRTTRSLIAAGVSCCSGRRTNKRPRTPFVWRRTRQLSPISAASGSQ